MDHTRLTMELRPLHEGAYTRISLKGPVVTTPSARDIRRLLGVLAGLYDQTLQIHAPVDLYTPAAGAGTETLATLYQSVNLSENKPAITKRNVDAGQAAAFAFNLAKSVIYTRQGNKDWAGVEKDNASPPALRSADMFIDGGPEGGATDWVNPDRVTIPQADEHQRLFAKLIAMMSRRPLPRFWYLPDRRLAAMVMTGDEHADGDTALHFAGQYQSSSTPTGCSVEGWRCIRGTSCAYAQTALTVFSDTAANDRDKQGFEVALHPNLGATPEGVCNSYPSQVNLPLTYDFQLRDFALKCPSPPPPSTVRTHCVVWSDWAMQANVELSHGIRLDTNYYYYYYPFEYTDNHPAALFTGSGFPMRFADADGAIIDVYQAATQLNDEPNRPDQSYVAGRISPRSWSAPGASARDAGRTVVAA
jgi:hypothetical protein